MAPGSDINRPKPWQSGHARITVENPSKITCRFKTPGA